MPKERVFICIRLKPDKTKPPETQKAEFEENLRRAKVVARYAALAGFDPEATTIYYTQFLNDFSEEERQIGIQLGRERLLSCQRLWWINNDGPEDAPVSQGKIGDRKAAEEHGIPIEERDYNQIENWIKEYDGFKK